jgi:hypothetical protein
MSQSAGVPPDPATADSPPRRIYRTHYIHSLWVQGVYYLVSGVWPLVSMDTFLAVTGPKTDLWLVRTVGALITLIAIVLLIAASRQDRWTEIGVLAVGSASVLFATDVIHVSLGVIPPIYLADAAVELVLISWWVVILTRGSKQLPF